MSDPRLHVRIPEPLKDQLQVYSKSRKLSMAEVVQAALEDFLDPADYKTVSLNYLAKIERENRSQLKRLELLEETLGQFVNLFFFYTPEMPDDLEVKRAAQASAKSRTDRFLHLIAKRLRSSNTFRAAFEDVVFAAEDFHLGGSE